MYKGYIYKFENIFNGKVYIGKTKNIENRIYQHKHTTSTKSTKFGKAIKKYGIDNFKISIVVEIKSVNIDNLDIILNCLERAFIKRYDSFKTGYNCTLGGDGTINFHHSEETKEKLRNRVVSEVTRRKLGDIHRGKPSRRRLTKKWKDSVIKAKSIPVFQYSKDGVLINKWKSITEAAKYYNLPKSCISRVCKNERKSCGGFIWKYC